jgi:hypothetical protein
LPSTDSRTRAEWLAEVRRRGQRIRRRRRLAFTAVGALAMVLPLSAVATLLDDQPGREEVELTAAGPGPTSDLLLRAVPTTFVVGSETARAPEATGLAATTEAAPGPAVADPSPSTTAEVPARPPAAGSIAPAPPATVASSDDPVVRAPTTIPSAGNAGSPAGRAAGAQTVQTTIPGGADPSLAPCPAVDVRVSVVTEKASYGRGETVAGTSVLENRSAEACLLPTRAFFRVEDATGKLVGSFAYTTEFRIPVKAEPGRTFTSQFTWDQRDCSGATCAQVPAGTYVAVADWTESGPYTGRVSFQIGA